jgi:Mrp family chromosome partitioning ATPase
MSKTYEALIQAEKSYVEVPVTSSYVSDWKCPNFSIKKEIANASQRMILNPGKDVSVLHFASSLEGEGTSTIVYNLARFLMGKNSDTKFLLIDANLRHPVLHQSFNLPIGPGLSEVLIKKAQYSEAIHRIGSSNIYVMPVGALPESSKIEQNIFFEFMSILRTQYQKILLDSPPLLASPDSITLAKISDITFLVIQSHMIKWQVAERAKLRLQRNDCVIGGVILNRVQRPIPQWIYKRL